MISPQVAYDYSILQVTI